MFTNYENLNIGQVQDAIEKGIFTEITFDADNKIILVQEAEYLRAKESIKIVWSAIKDVTKVVENIISNICNALSDFGRNFSNLLDKKITKKKFIKLLQSKGIQRNKINEIIRNNRERYTYARYYNVIRNFKR